MDDLFWAKVKKTDGCWEWKGAVNNHGYGVLKRRKIKKTAIYAHRYSFFMHWGHWPKGFACHHCDNPVCVRPSHLYDGTALENSQDMLRRNRLKSVSQRGVKNNNSKLESCDVSHIRFLICIGLNNKQIAKKFAVHHSTISAIRTGKSWQ